MESEKRRPYERRFSNKRLWNLFARFEKRLDDIASEMSKIRVEITRLSQPSIFHVPPEDFDRWMKLLPDHLRRTMLAIIAIQPCDATQIGKYTSRARAVESSYANQLVMMKRVRKKKDGRRVVFYL